MDRRQVRLGLVGYGEIGRGIAAGLRETGLVHISAFDTGAFSGSYSTLKQSHARAAGVTLARSARDLAESADLVIAAVPASSCLAAVQAIGPYLAAQHAYLDLASTTPAVKRQACKAAGMGGAMVADGGIMSSPLHDGHAILIKASGPGADIFAGSLNPWGMRIEVLGTELGAATAIKILRSVVMKGLEALLHEAMIGSERYGIRNAVLATIAEFMDARPFADTARFLLRSGVIHAARRSEEVAMAAEAIADAGLSPTMSAASAKLLGDVASLGLKERFGGKVPDDWDDAVRAVNTGLRERG